MPFFFNLRYMYIHFNLALHLLRVFSFSLFLHNFLRVKARGVSEHGMKLFGRE